MDYEIYVRNKQKKTRNIRSQTNDGVSRDTRIKWKKKKDLVSTETNWMSQAKKNACCNETCSFFRGESNSRWHYWKCFWRCILYSTTIHTYTHTHTNTNTRFIYMRNHFYYIDFHVDAVAFSVSSTFLYDLLHIWNLFSSVVMLIYEESALSSWFLCKHV